MKAKAGEQKNDGLRIQIPGGAALKVVDVVYSYTSGNRSIAMVRLEDGRSAFLRQKPNTQNWYLLAVPL